MKTKLHFKTLLTLNVTLVLLVMVVKDNQNTTVTLSIVIVLAILILATLDEADKIAAVLQTILHHFKQKDGENL